MCEVWIFARLMNPTCTCPSPRPVDGPARCSRDRRRPRNSARGDGPRSSPRGCQSPCHRRAAVHDDFHGSLFCGFPHRRSAREHCRRARASDGVHGVYGMVSYSVAQRNREIGIRMALGAERNPGTAALISEGFRPILFGVAIGIVASGASRVRFRQRSSTQSLDTVSFAGVSLLLDRNSVACYVASRTPSHKVDHSGAALRMIFRSLKQIV